MSDRLFLTTIDCDHVRESPQELRRDAMQALLDTFDEVGAGGHTTWFVNECYFDYSLTEHHGPLLHEMIRRGDTLGLHDHIDLLDGRWQYQPIYDYCKTSKEKLSAWLTANGYRVRLRYHRFGCLFQRESAYEAIRDLGYTIVSDVWPGHESKNHTGHLSFDNRDMPLGIRPYRHDPPNWQDAASRSGCFLHIPVMHMYLRDLELSIAEQWIAAAEDRPDPLVLTFLMHPYEVINDERTAVDPAKVDKLRSILVEIELRLNVVFANMNECVKACDSGG